MRTLRLLIRIRLYFSVWSQKNQKDECDFFCLFVCFDVASYCPDLTTFILPINNLLPSQVNSPRTTSECSRAARINSSDTSFKLQRLFLMFSALSDSWLLILRLKIMKKLHLQWGIHFPPCGADCCFFPHRLIEKSVKVKHRRVKVTSDQYEQNTFLSFVTVLHHSYTHKHSLCC